MDATLTKKGKKVACSPLSAGNPVPKIMYCIFVIFARTQFCYIITYIRLRLVGILAFCVQSHVLVYSALFF